MKSELKNRFSVENTQWNTGRNDGPASQATHTLAKVSAPSLEDWAAGLQLQIEFTSRKQTLRRCASRKSPGRALEATSGAGQLWCSVHCAPWRPPPRELTACRTVPSWGSHWGQDTPRKGAWRRACSFSASGQGWATSCLQHSQHFQRAWEVPSWRDGRDLEGAMQCQHDGPAQSKATFTRLANGCWNVKPSEKK